MNSPQSKFERALLDMSTTDIEQAREIAVALCGHGEWREGWIDACRRGSYDDGPDVQGPLLGIKIGRGMGPQGEQALTRMKSICC